MSYVPNPTDVNEPIDERVAGTMAAEFRAIKTYLQATILKAITDNKKVSDDSLAAINTKMDSATGVAGLPTDKGILACIQTIWGQLNTQTSGIVDKLAGAVNNGNSNAQAIIATDKSVQTLATALNQLTQSFNALNTKYTEFTKNVKVELPVGAVLVTKNSANPSTYLGYGIWKPACVGTYLAGVGASTYSGGAGYNFPTAGANYGEPRSVISKACMPQHRHASNVIVRIGDAYGQTLTTVDNIATSAGTAIGDSSTHYTRTFDGLYKCTWHGAEDFGYSVQAIPYTGYAGGRYVASADGKSTALGGTQPFEIKPYNTAYYMWERTA